MTEACASNDIGIETCYVPMVDDFQNVCVNSVNNIANLSVPNRVLNEDVEGRPRTLVRNLLFSNIQSLQNKTLEIDMVLSGGNYCALCFSEHWLKQENLELIRLSGFSLASAFCRSVAKNGGVAVFVENELLSDIKVIDVSKFCAELHHEFACIIVPKLSVIMLGVYRSPDGDFTEFTTSLERLILSLDSYRQKYFLVVGGDFNVDFLLVNDPKTEDLKNVLKSLNLYCTNNHPTRLKACLDNVATDLPMDKYEVNVLSCALSDHDPIKFGVYHSDISIIDKPKRQLCVTRITPEGLDRFKHDLGQIDWLAQLSVRGVDDNCDKFLSIFRSLFAQCFPSKLVNVGQVRKKQVPKWFTDKSVTEMKKWVLLAYDIFKLSQCAEDRQRYINLKRHYKHRLKVAKLNYNADRIDSAANRCTKAWEVIREETAPPSCRQVNITPDEFNSHFKEAVLRTREEIGVPDVTAQQFLDSIPRPVCQFKWKLASCKQVSDIVKRMKPSSSKDIYGISSKLVKLVISKIVFPLTLILNMCLIEGKYPACLKKARVLPLFKKGSRTLPGSYRPISILPIFSKIFETFMTMQLYEYFESNNLFSASQYGFRKGLSTIDAVECLVRRVLDAFERRGLVGATLCDLRMAFDTLDPGVVVSKFEYYGVRGRELALLESFTGDREQTVCVDGQCSEAVRVEFGSPQGSNMAPFMFIVAMNDLSFYWDGEEICYVDDTTLVDDEEDLYTLRESMGTYLQHAAVWFQANYFMLNNDKTQEIIFTLRKENIVPTSAKLLGITLDSKLTWGPHVATVCNKLSRVLFLLRRLKDCVSLDYLRTAYLAFFQGVVLYGLKLWGVAADTHKVLLMQKKAVRVLAGAAYDAHCKPLFIELKLMTVFSLFIFVTVLDTIADVDLLPLRSDIHKHNTRNSHLLDVPYTRLKKLQLNLGLRLKLINHLPCKAWNQKPSKFKQNLQNLLLANPLYSVKDFFDLSTATVDSFF